MNGTRGYSCNLNVKKKVCDNDQEEWGFLVVVVVVLKISLLDRLRHGIDVSK